jgi:hypothetical protein
MTMLLGLNKNVTDSYNQHALHIYKFISISQGRKLHIYMYISSAIAANNTRDQANSDTECVNFH